MEEEQSPFFSEDKLLDEEDDASKMLDEESSSDPPMIRSKFVLCVLIFCVVLIPIIGFLAIGIPADTDSLSVGIIIKQDDGTLKIPIETSSSALAFCFTSQKLDDKILYLTPHLSLSSFLHSSGNTTVITKAKENEISAVLLQGSNEDDRVQIWP